MSFSAKAPAIAENSEHLDTIIALKINYKGETYIILIDYYYIEIKVRRLNHFTPNLRLGIYYILWYLTIFLRSTFLFLF